MKKQRRMALCCIMLLVVCVCVVGCGNGKAALAGEYAFTETYSGSSGRADMNQREWKLALQEDGTYKMTCTFEAKSSGWFGPTEITTTEYAFGGTYTVQGDKVTCSAPETVTQTLISAVDGDGNSIEKDNLNVPEDVDPVVVLTSNFFNEDLSSEWKVDASSHTAVPTKYREPVSNRDNF